jgi:hypothetical protein
VNPLSETDGLASAAPVLKPKPALPSQVVKPYVTRQRTSVPPISNGKTPPTSGTANLIGRECPSKLQDGG